MYVVPRLHLERFEGRMIRIENRQPKAKRGYFAKCLNLKVDFFWQKDYFMYVFKKK